MCSHLTRVDVAGDKNIFPRGERDVTADDASPFSPSAERERTDAAGDTYRGARGDCN